MLPNVGTWEMIIILLVVFLVFGANRLPDIARGLGKGMREFKREMQGIASAIDVTAEPTAQSRPQPGQGSAAPETTDATVESDEADGAEDKQKPTSDA